MSEIDNKGQRFVEKVIAEERGLNETVATYPARSRPGLGSVATRASGVAVIPGLQDARNGD